MSSKLQSIWKMCILPEQRFRYPCQFQTILISAWIIVLYCHEIVSWTTAVNPIKLHTKSEVLYSCCLQEITDQNHHNSMTTSWYGNATGIYQSPVLWEASTLILRQRLGKFSPKSFKSYTRFCPFFENFVDIFYVIINTAHIVASYCRVITYDLARGHKMYNW